jgi:hypothetical protein
MYRPALVAVVTAAFVQSFPGLARAQLEPEAFTILKAAATKIAPDPKGILYAVKSGRTDEDRQKLSDVWLKVWKGDVTAFEAFDTSFVGANRASEAAARLIRTPHPTLSPKAVRQAASDLLDRLAALSMAERQDLREFTRLAIRRINKK